MSDQRKATEGYLEYQRKMRELESQTKDRARQEKISANVEAWLYKYAPNFASGYRISQLTESEIANVKKAPIGKEPFDKMIVSCSTTGHRALLCTYAIVYELIRTGRAEPSKVRRTSALDAYNNINGMYQSREWKDKFFDSQAQVLIIEGTSQELAMLASRGETQFWRELVEFTRDGSRLVLIAYTMSDDEIKNLCKLSVILPSLTADTALNRSMATDLFLIPLGIE